MSLLYECYSYYKNNTVFCKWFFQYIEVIIPIILTSTYEQIEFSGKEQASFSLAFCLLLWLIRFFFMSEDLKNRRARISKLAEFVEILTCCSVNLLSILAY